MPHKSLFGVCGIAGIIGSNQPGDIRQMTAALTHRGPDAEGFWHDEGCALGHRRLSIIDLSSAANQPFHSQYGRYTMVFNGEVYNYRKIAKDLNISSKTTSDTEILLEAFVRKGPAFVHLLNGEFSIAIWDKQQQKLHLFRDRMGIKPLYYYQDKERLIFSSELKGICALADVRKNLEIDPEALRHFFHSGYIPEPWSIWKQVRKFPKGHLACFTPGKTLQPTPYWRLEDQIEQQVLSDEGAATAKLEELLTDSVKLRMLSDVPLGTFLSGGIDSSLVTALAQSLSGKPIPTFSIGFEVAKYNETAFARRVAEHLKTNHHEFILRERDAINLVPDIASVYDEPFADSSAIPTMLVSKMARKEVVVTLSGDGGDESFLGYNSYRWASRLNHPAVRALRKPAGALLAVGSDRMRRVSWLFEQPFDANSGPAHLFSKEQHLYSAQEAALLASANHSDWVLRPSQKLSRKLTAAERQALFDLQYYLPDDLLVKVDRASMRYGLETRVPLLDHRIVSFALNLHTNLKIRGGDSKYLLKKILYKHVPAELFDRPKWGFSIPLVHWMRGELNPYVEDILRSASLNDALGIRVDEIPAVIKWRKGDDLHYNKVWQLVVLGQFLEHRKSF